MDLTDEQWYIIQPLLPPQPRSGGRGRPHLDQRCILDGILWKLRCRIPWRAIPARYGSHQVCYLYYSRWQKTGLMQEIIRALVDDLKTRGKFDCEQALKDGLVKVERCGSRFVVYFRFPVSETWQASTSMLFYQPVVQSAEKEEREKARY